MALKMILVPVILVVFFNQQNINNLVFGANSCRNFNVEGNTRMLYDYDESTGEYKGDVSPPSGTKIYVYCPSGRITYTCNNDKWNSEPPLVCPPITTTTVPTTPYNSTTPFNITTTETPTTTADPMATYDGDIASGTTTKKPRVFLPPCEPMKTGLKNSSFAYPESYASFPVCPLGTGNAMPLISLDDLIRCRSIQANTRNPNNNESAINIHFAFSIGDNFKVDTLGEMLSFNANLSMAWEIDNCDADLTASQVDLPERLVVTEIDKIFHPRLRMTTNQKDMLMNDRLIGDYIEINYHPTGPNRTLTFFWTRFGEFRSKCRLNLAKFPYDKQTCQITFSFTEPNDFIQFGKVTSRIAGLSTNSEWSIDGPMTTTVTSYPSITLAGASVSAAVFTINLTRSPDYYLANILGPCLILVLLELASFKALPNDVNRAVLKMTILLGLVYAHSGLLDVSPKSLYYGVLITEYFLYLTLFSGFCVIYDFFMLLLCLAAPKRMLVKEICCELTTARFIDAVAFSLAVLGFCAINVYCYRDATH